MEPSQPMILCDTNILVELYKNNPTVINELQKIGMNQIAISIITQAEITARSPAGRSQASLCPHKC
jgi:predicted nucleic acid-binding protein